jgi:hypothetical protein
MFQADALKGKTSPGSVPGRIADLHPIPAGHASGQFRQYRFNPVQVKNRILIGQPV